MIYLKETLTPMLNEYNDLQKNSATRVPTSKDKSMIRHTDSDKERPIYKLVHFAPVESFNDFHVSFWKLDRAELVDLLQSFSEHGELTLVQLKEKIVETVVSPFLEAEMMGQYHLNPLTIKRYTDIELENMKSMNPKKIRMIIISNIVRNKGIFRNTNFNPNGNNCLKKIF